MIHCQTCWSSPIEKCFWKESAIPGGEMSGKGQNSTDSSLVSASISTCHVPEHSNRPNIWDKPTRSRSESGQRNSSAVIWDIGDPNFEGRVLSRLYDTIDADFVTITLLENAWRAVTVILFQMFSNNSLVAFSDFLTFSNSPLKLCFRIFDARFINCFINFNPDASDGQKYFKFSNLIKCSWYF